MGAVLWARVWAGDGGCGARLVEEGVCGCVEGEGCVCGVGVGREYGGAAGLVCAVEGRAGEGDGGS